MIYIRLSSGRYSVHFRLISLVSLKNWQQWLQIIDVHKLGRVEICSSLKLKLFKLKIPAFRAQKYLRRPKEIDFELQFGLKQLEFRA